MALDAQGYFQYLNSYLNMDYYAIETNMHNELKLKEKISIPDGYKEIEILFKIEGEAFAFKLDKINDEPKHPRKGKRLKLFHFLNDEGKPWSRRCDFVIFHLHKKKIKVYCFEFKYESLPVAGIISQLKASEDWCRSVYSIINIYTNKRKRINLTKYVLSYCEEPEKYLDRVGKYLKRDPSIRHYHYDDVNGINLHDLEHETIEVIG